MNAFPVRAGCTENTNGGHSIVANLNVTAFVARWTCEIQPVLVGPRKITVLQYSDWRKAGFAVWADDFWHG